jgi:PAS domain-containing protein
VAVAAGTGNTRPAFSEAWLVAVLDSLSEGVIAIDGEGRLTAANPAAERLLGFDVSERRSELWSHLAFRDLEDVSGRPLEPHPVAQALVERVPSTVTALATVPTGRRWLELGTHILDPVAGAGSGSSCPSATSAPACARRRTGSGCWPSSATSSR